MKKSRYLLALSILGLAACSPEGTLQVLSVTKDLGCIVSTPEKRAEIRDNQTIKTNFCADELVE